MKHRLMLMTIGVAMAASAALAADEASEPKAAGEKPLLSRVHFKAEADVETSYHARGAIVDKNPFSAQSVDLSIDLDPLGYVGGYAWSVSSMSRGGQSATRQNFYNEVDYGAYYGYALKFADGWALDSNVAAKWVTLPGYHPHAETISEVNVSQALVNPYVTPYYLLRSAVDGGGKWNYWDVGLKRTWTLCEGLTFLTQVYAELGDSRHLRAQYGANPNCADGSYSPGIMALNLLLRLDYALTDWLSVFAFVHQFDVVSGDGRDALDASSAPEAIKDLTIGGVGFTLRF